MAFLVSVVVFAAVIFAFRLVARAYRRPDHPVWLDRESVAVSVCVGFTAALGLSFASLVTSAFALPLPVWADSALFAAAVIGAFVVARLLVHRTPAGTAAAGR